MNTTTDQVGPLHVSSDINKAATGVGFYWSEGQVVETLHARPADVVAYIDDAALGDRMAKALAEGTLTTADAVEFAALISTPVQITERADVPDIHHDMFNAEGRPILERFVALAKAQILDMMRDGTIPKDCDTFGALHDHCDANEFGDICVDAIYDKMNKALRTDKDDPECMSEGMMTFTNKMQDILDEWLRARLPDPHGHDTKFVKIATPIKVTVDGSDEVFSAFTLGASWNGFAYPYLIKDVGEMLADEMDDAINGPAIKFDAAADAFVENYGDDAEGYKGEDIVTANGVVHVYAIGSGGWTWSVLEPESDDDAAEDETPAHDASTLRRAYLALRDAALELRQELGACAEQGRDSHEQESDLWPSGEEVLEALETWAESSADAITKAGAK